MSSALLSTAYLPGHFDLVQEGAASAGLKADRRQWRIARDIFVGPTSKIAHERARAVMGRNYEEHQRHSRKGTLQVQCCKIDPSMPDEAVDLDYLMENLWIIGDAEECAEKIHALHATVGGFGTLLCTTVDSDNPSWDHESLRLLAEEVRPRIADL